MGECSRHSSPVLCREGWGKPWAREKIKKESARKGTGEVSIGGGTNSKKEIWGRDTPQGRKKKRRPVEKGEQRDRGELNEDAGEKNLG